MSNLQPFKVCVAKNLRQRERGIMLKLNEYDPFPKKRQDILLKTQGGRSNFFLSILGGILKGEIAGYSLIPFYSQ